MHVRRHLVLILLVALASFATAQGSEPSSPDAVGAPIADLLASDVQETYDATTRQEALEQIERAGLYVLDVDTIVRHVHARLTVRVDGVPVLVPQTGVDLDTITAAPVHTHGTDGILHIEADEEHADVELHLSDFLAVLGAGRTREDVCRFYLAHDHCVVTVTVDGRVASLEHILDDGQRIELAVVSNMLV